MTVTMDTIFFDERVNHLFYMDNLKLFGKNDSEIEGLLKTVK